MPSKNQLTGMRGVYLVAAELTRHGFIASPTSRSARGADILVTDQHCKNAFSVQVKTNASTFSFWLLSESAKGMISSSHIYVLVNLKSGGSQIEYFIIPSEVLAKKMLIAKQGNNIWYSINRKDIEEYKDKWDIFEAQINK
jgi:hypothetical protein